jgi:hypothetical protein
MAETNTQPLIEQPKKETSPDLVRVFSMPEKYRHGAVVNMVEPQKASTTPVAAIQPPVPPKPVAPLPPAANKMVQPTHTKKGLLIAGIVVLIALGIGGYLLLRSSQKNKESVPAGQTQTETTTPATPVTETPVVPETPTTPATTGTSPFPAAVTPGVDTDSDGLTDTEETIVYGTDSALPDSDTDGFLDGNEVFHGYNPNGTAPGTLVLANLAQVLVANGFHLSYPSKWSILAGESGAYEVSTTTSEIVKISSVSKEATLSLSDWYDQTVKDGTLSLSKTKKTYPLLMAKNQLTAYVDLGTMVVTLAYDTSVKTTIDYLTTFQMMINSMEVNK